jgi:hypothetical protein
VTPDQLAPIVALLSDTMVLEIANPESEPETVNVSLNLLIFWTWTPLTLCDAADVVVVMLSTALFRTIESSRKLVPSFEVEIRDAASTSSAIRLEIVSWPPLLANADPTVPELIAAFATATDMPVSLAFLGVCWTTNSALKPWSIWQAEMSGSLLRGNAM